MSTYIEGNIIKKTRSHWVVRTRNGTYWVATLRHPYFTRRISAKETGFWVQVRDIKRFKRNS